jgi:hypothetical protein
MAKGLCKRCGKKWFKGHKCVAAIQLNALHEVWDILEAGDADQDTLFETEQTYMTISIAIIVGTKAPKTLCIRGIIQNMEILVLIDSRSSHSFISQQVAAQLQGVSACASTARVQVAYGNSMYCHSQLLNAEWFLQGYKFSSDLQVLDLPSFDMVVGMEWLERYPPMRVHWSHKWLTIPYQNSQITLQCLTPGILNCAIIELLHIHSDAEHTESDQILPAMQ